MNIEVTKNKEESKKPDGGSGFSGIYYKDNVGISINPINLEKLRII